MKMVDNLEDFVKYNDGDIRAFIHSKYKNALLVNEMDDICQGFYMRLAISDAVAKFDLSFNVKFSTYIYKCLYNYILAYEIHETGSKRIIRNSKSLDYEIDETGHTIHDIFEDENQIIDSGEDRVYLDQINDALSQLTYRKRKVSSYMLFNYYREGYTDTEIAPLVDMTIAGVGSAKKILRRDIQKIISCPLH